MIVTMNIILAVRLSLGLSTQALSSCHVLKYTFVLLSPFNVAPLNERFKPDFDLGWLWGEPDGEKPCRLSHQIRVVYLSSCLHNLDHGSLNGVPSIVFHLALDLLCVGLLLRLGVEHGHLVAIHVALELQIDLHGVLGGERIDRWILRQNFLLDQRDQVLVQLVRWDLSHLKELLVCDDRVLVEEEQ